MDLPRPGRPRLGLRDDDDSAIASRRGADAIHLEPGCTGPDRHLDVLTSAADAVKVAEGVHDLAIDGGSVVCTAKLADHAPGRDPGDGRERITLRGLSINCGRSGQSLINSNLFINQRGTVDQSADRRRLRRLLPRRLRGAHGEHPESVRSGVVSSTLCTAKYPKLTLTVGPIAVDPVDSGNTLDTC